MAGNLFMVVGLVFLMLFIRVMIGQYDSSLCNSQYNYQNETLPSGETPAQQTDIYSFITGIKCSNLDWWIQLLIYTPIIAGIIYLLIPIPFKV